MKFEKVISLGGDCATRHHLDRALKVIDPLFSAETFFFDWLWSDRGFESILIALKDKLAFEEHEFKLKLIGQAYQVHHQKTGFYFPHDFKFTNNTSNFKDQVQAEFDEQYQAFNLKYRYLAQKTLDLMFSDSYCLFISAKQDISQEQINKFFDMLGANSLVLHLPELNREAAFVPMHDRLISKPIIHKDIDWKGNKKSWDEIFFQSGIF